jgi:PAS domain S-box-containing protein
VHQRTLDLQKEVMERRIVEQELRASEELFRQLTENIKGVFWMTNVDKNQMIYISPGYESIWGRSCESLYASPRSWLEAIDPEDRERVTAAALKQNAGAYDVQYRIVRPDGSRRWIRDQAFPVYDAQGVVYRIAGIADDVTQRKQAEAALAEKEERFRRFMDNSAIIAFVKDEAGKYVYVNSTLQRPFEISLLGKTSFDVFPLEVAQRLHENDRKVLATGQTLEFTDSISFPDGTAGDWINYKFPFKDASEHTFVGCLSIEITQQRRLEKQLLEISDREQARIGHDLHDQLCQFLVSIAFDCRHLEDHLEISGGPEAAQAKKIAELVDSAISQARQLARGLFPVHLETNGLAGALQELSASMSSRFKVGCSVECPQPVSIRETFVANHLYRIAQEAVTNATRHGHAHRIAIRLGVLDSNLELSVSDDGIGLAPNSPPDGMGLHIMDYRARSIGGVLDIQTQPGGGTSIICRVPVRNI